ncbi:MAG: M24 family metallopeptidase [Candidatus Limiplasma sp.]|nr:M24 family metallopeptidase [Candidatus Limiplasma sp.]
MRERSELQIKLKRLRDVMEAEGLEGVYLKRQDNFAWLTCGGCNYLGVGDMGNCGLLVTKTERFAITNHIESPRMIAEEGLEDLGFPVLADIWLNETFESDTIRKICPGGKVGYDFAAPNGANLAGEIQTLRYALLPEEIQRYKEGGALYSRAVEEAAAVIRPGDTELEAVSRLVAAARADGLWAVSSFCTSDERIYQFRHAIATAKPIRERVQFGGNFRYKGLVLCCTRYVNFVPVTQELHKQYLDNVRIDCTYIHNSKAGASYQAPFQAGRKAYEELGYPGEFEKHHQGGPIGYVAREFLMSGSREGVIAENQAFCWNPSITGTKSEDTVIATAQGPLFVTYPVLFPRVKVEIEGTEYTRPYILEK